jgi:hypothetical protein
MSATGLAEVAIFGGALLIFTDKQWMRVTGWCAIVVGLVLVMAAGTMRNA